MIGTRTYLPRLHTCLSTWRCAPVTRLKQMTSGLRRQLSPGRRPSGGVRNLSWSGAVRCSRCASNAPVRPPRRGKNCVVSAALCTVGGCWSVGFFVPGMCRCSSCKRKKNWYKLATWAGRISVPRKQGKISHRAPSRSEEQLLRLVLFVFVPSKCDAVLISVSWNFGTICCQTL